MDNKYISQFINSKNIREHLLRIGYEFTTVQYAYLIWQCKTLTIKQRHKEWKLLIKKTPDCDYTSRAFPEKTSFHKLLSDYMDWEKKIINLFKKTEPNTFYTNEYHELIGIHEWTGGEEFFDSYENCEAWEYAIDNEIPFRITKNYIDNSEWCSAGIVAYYDKNGKMTDIGHHRLISPHSFSEYERALENEFFDDMWFDFPIPFHKGDIVCDCFERKPFVLTSTDPWLEQEKANRRPNTHNYKTHFDMNASGYSFDKKTNTLHWDWLEYRYMNLEYYRYYLRDKLEDGDRFLKAYSMFLNDSIDIDTLLKIYQIIQSECIAKTNFKELDCWIDEPTKAALGLDKYVERRDPK